MKYKIKKFFTTLWYYLSFPFYKLYTRKVEKKLTRIAIENRADLLTEKDAEFLKTLGLEKDLETLRTECKKVKK